MSAQPPLPPNQQPPQQQPDYGRAAQEAMAKARAAAQDAVKTFMSLIYNPVGALPGAFASLRGNQAMGVGIVFMVAYSVLAAIGAQLLVSAVIAAFTGGLGGGPGFSFKDFFKLLFGSLVFAGGVGLGCFVLRTALKAAGSVATDILLAGAALIPLGIALLAGAIVGKIVAALGVAVLIVGFSLTVLVLFTGFTRIGGVKEGPASYLVALTLVIGGAVSWMVGRIFS